MLRLKQAELREHVQAEMERLERVEARLKQLEKENFMSTYDVVIKKVEPVLVAGVREFIPAYPEQGHLWEKLETYLQRQGATPSGPCLTLYYQDEPEIDAECCEPLGAPLPAAGPVQVHALPAVAQMASVIHHGPFTTLGEAYGALIKWIEENGYRIAGPGREIYIKPPLTPGSQVDPNTVTEIQFPIEKG